MCIMKYKKIVLLVVALVVSFSVIAESASRSSLKAVVKEAIREELGVTSDAYRGGWEYTALSMRPPKNEKWQTKWNELGSQGWKLVQRNENIYIFRRPSIYGGVSSKPTEETLTEPKPAASPAATGVVESTFESTTQEIKHPRRGRKNW